jgi:hypothetical protein
MPNQALKSKTGSASIDQQGHTSSGRFGSQINAKAQRGSVRTLSPRG